jgi:hypothetical protein
MAPVVVVRPTWYREGFGAATFDSVESGQALYGRLNDAWRTFLREPDGWLIHLFDTPVSSLPTVNSP